ncbi:hypothetical protein IV203_011916 [Nitzschia inconspicua]|uniref:Uncharacterized protein n=1 Tax=Nitzschia inconspicua TaxID=303405 RepID=A0A9K3PLF3_9STRA|nr:hypothetical protein IV203_011916 [Nitzschia inconspicua]
MTNIACITSYAEMERNLKNGIAFARFGAKITDWTQACDVGLAFRTTKKSKSRTTIAESCDQALKTTFNRILETHYLLGSILPNSLGRKHEAIADCVATAPRVHSAWAKRRCRLPSLRGLARPLYSQIKIQEKTREMVDGLEKERQKRGSVIEAAKCTFQMNVEAESRLQKIAVEKNSRSVELLTYEDLIRLDIKHLIPYIQVREVTDLAEPCNRLKKGTAQQAEEGQSCLLLQAKAVIGKNITTVIPEIGVM